MNRQMKRRAFTLIELVVVILIIGALVILLAPYTSCSRESARRMQCTNNMKWLALAMHNYHDENGCFPPAYVADDEGKPLYSWRVLLLPYLEQKALYDKFHLDEPWDSPANQEVVGDMKILVFQCPSSARPKNEADKIAPTSTSYVMVVGPGMFSDGTNCVTKDDITDGLSKTVMLAEVRNSDIHWAEPRDLDAEMLLLGINCEKTNQVCLGSLHPGGMNVAYADGSVHFIDENADPIRLRALFTIAGEDGPESGYFDDWLITTGKK